MKSNRWSLTAVGISHQLSKPRRQAVGLLAAALITCGSQARSGVVPVPVPTGPVRAAIIADPHIFDAVRLGWGGAASDAYVAADPKLLPESRAVFEAALDGILHENVNFVIIPGDLTKDGELRDHVLMASYLAKLERRGIQVFVVPGNHDINNHDAVRYVGDTNRPVPTVTARMFKAIYHRFGYGQAIKSDAASLSYVAEPVQGLWLLAIDSCKYDESRTNAHPVVSGRIRPETMAWIQSVMQDAHAQGKKVIAFTHHGVNQHFFGEQNFFADFLLDNWVATSMQLAQTGLKVIFTGHYHSTDAAYLVDANLNPLSPLCDVETASLAVYPCAYRIATLDSQDQLHIETRRVSSINHDTGGVPFQQYAFSACFAPTVDIATERIESTFGVPHDQAAAVAPLIAMGIMANYAGDENPSPETQTLIAQFIGNPEPQHTLGLLLWGLWTDLPPGPTTGALDSELVLPID